MTERGELTIGFNKKFIMPNFIDARQLNNSIPIEDFISLKVIDNEDDDDLDKTI